MSYKLTLSTPALKTLRDLRPPVSTRIAVALDKLKEDPRPAGCVKLQGREVIWRIRVGDYRIVYTIDDEIRIIDVRKIGHRGDVYR